MDIDLAMRRTRRAETLLLLFVWSSLLYLGIELYLGVVNQGLPDFPQPGQFRLYVLFPSVLVLLNVLSFASSRKLPTVWFATLVAAQFVCLPVLLLFGGGV